jgi:hypothetical protein
MDHPRSVEPPPWNVQQCYAHIDIEKGDGAPSIETNTDSRRAEKHAVTPEHSKKRSGSSETTRILENLTTKRRRMIQSWSNEDEEENLAADLLTPHQRKGVEQTS